MDSDDLLGRGPQPSATLVPTAGLYASNLQSDSWPDVHDVASLTETKEPHSIPIPADASCNRGLHAMAPASSAGGGAAAPTLPLREDDTEAQDEAVSVVLPLQQQPQSSPRTGALASQPSAHGWASMTRPSPLDNETKPSRNDGVTESARSPPLYSRQSLSSPPLAAFAGLLSAHSGYTGGLTSAARSTNDAFAPLGAPGSAVPCS